MINEKGELLDFDLTPGNVADNNHGLLKSILKKITGLCFGDREYATTLWKDFYENGLKIVTKTKGKTKAKLMTLQEHYMLLKRPIIESMNDIFTSVFDLEHSRHRIHSQPELIEINEPYFEQINKERLEANRTSCYKVA